MTRLGAISFINTIPVYLSFQPPIPLELIYNTPARLNAAIAEGRLDVSPVSSAYYLQHQDDLILLGDLSVSSFGAVESVLFLSRYPAGSEKFINFYQQHPEAVIPVPDDSETSVNLLAWLLKEETGLDLSSRFQVFPAHEYQVALATHQAALVIGDQALLIHESPTLTMQYHCTDLSGEWVKRTELPFVFAVWVARREWTEQHPDEFIALNQALIDSRRRFFTEPGQLEKGVQAAQEKCSLSPEVIRRYFTQALNYELSASHLDALNHFGMILGQLTTPVPTHA